MLYQLWYITYTSKEREEHAYWILSTLFMNGILKGRKSNVTELIVVAKIVRYIIRFLYLSTSWQ